MTYLLHVDERLCQVVVENVGVSFFVALHGTDGHDYAVFVDAIATPVPVKLGKIVSSVNKVHIGFTLTFVPKIYAKC